MSDDKNLQQLPPKKNQLHGIIKTNSEDGQLRYRTDYRHNKRHGMHCCWTPDGELFFQEYYINGIEVTPDRWIMFDLMRRTRLERIMKFRAMRESRQK